MTTILIYAGVYAVGVMKWQALEMLAYGILLSILAVLGGFVGRWMDILRPGFQRVADLPPEEILQALEKQAVLVSLENLMTFPFVKAAVEDDRLTLHGLWTDTGEGGLEQFDPARDGFVAV